MKNIHLMGISGSGMAGIATLATKMGYKVTGCDLKLNGHSKDHLKNTDLLIVSPAVYYQNEKHDELQEALKRKIAMTWQEFLGRYLMKGKKVIAIAGTHGKSTTTAMVAKILIDNGFDPSVVIGAYVSEWKGNSKFGKGDYFVVEADEFNDNFLNYYPEVLVINNIEFDHPDYFKNEKEVRASFKKIIKNLVGKKILITEEDSLNKKFNLTLMGLHNQKNANMAFLVGKHLDIEEKSIIKSLEEFKGIGRRMELIFDNGKAKVFDDYAHHTTAIKTTLEGLGERYPKEKILAVIEPHGYSRTRSLLPNYEGVFDNAHGVIVGPIYQARDKVDKNISPQIVAKASKHKEAYGLNSVEEIIRNTKLLVSKYGFTTIVVMGAGESSNWAKRIVDNLNESNSDKKVISFKNLTTLKVGGEIKYFKEVGTKDELIAAVTFAKKKKLPIFIIGGGTDIAVSDKEFNGVVIKFVGKNIKINDTTVTAEAGLNWDEFVKVTVDRNLQGIECLSGIPGSVGASPIQNIGAYGQEISETLLNLTAYDIENEKFIVFKNEDCKFKYRDSFFKQKENWQKFIIVDVTFNLKRYEDKDLELSTIREEILRVRAEKLEDPNNVPNAGSFFKNPIVTKEFRDNLMKKCPDAVNFPYQEKFKISAGWLIEKAGWKGKSLGPVKVSDKHALVLTNPEGKGNFADIKKLAEAITEDVYMIFEIKLEPEVQFINI